MRGQLSKMNKDNIPIIGAANFEMKWFNILPTYQEQVAMLSV